MGNIMNLNSNENSKNDKERDRKLKVLDEIDNLRVVENNNFMIGKFKDAIKVAENIIRLAKGAKLQFIIDEQTEFIKQVKKEQSEKDRISAIMSEFETIKRNFENLLKNNEIIKAHQLINGFKQKYGALTDLSSLPAIQDLILKEREIWINFLEEQEKIKKELMDENNKFMKFLKNKDFISTNKILEKVKPLLSVLMDKELKEKWDLNKQDYLEKKENFELCEKVDEAIEESLKFTDEFIFEEALFKVDSMSELIKGKSLIQCKNRLIETRKEIVAAEIKYNKLYLELAKFKEEFRYNREKEFLLALSRVCEKIIHVSQLIGMTEIEEQYQKSLEQIKKEIEEKESKNRKELEELLKKSKDIEKFIEIDKDILPIVEVFSVKEILGDLSENIKEKLEQISTLLLENRVKIKKEVMNRVILKTSSGEVVESAIPREIFTASEIGEEVTHSVNSGLTNRFDDIIEEAVITDIIPYNFEIINITLNGKVLKEFPEKRLKKEGIELKWEIENLKPKERIEIKYDLFRRISRTILFLIEDQLKIVKYHSNITDSQNKGLFIAEMSFTNSIGAKLDVVIVEDIIPSSFLHFIEEPKNLIPIKITGFEFGEIFRWDIGIMSDERIQFTYKLIDKNQFEEIKSEINNLNKEGLDYLNKGNILDALDKYKQIRNEIISKIK
jgi:hypothetical protein